MSGFAWVYEDGKGHGAKTLCPICHRLESLPADPNMGMYLCDCEAGGNGPCVVTVCLECVDRSMGTHPTLPIAKVTDRRGQDRRQS